jgi:hypothetical protein
MALATENLGLKKCAGVSRGNGAQRNDLAERNPGATEGSGNAYGSVETVELIPPSYGILLHTASLYQLHATCSVQISIN